MQRLRIGVMPRFETGRRAALVGAGAALIAGAARAQEVFPSRPIRMIIPFAAGAGADTVGRTFGEQLAKALGQPVVIDNKGGAGGLLGTAEGARAPADGYTLLLTSQGATVFNMGLYKAPGYDPLKDLIPVATTGILTNVMVVSAANPAKTVADVIAQARAKPGELTYGSSGVGTTHHLAGELFKILSKTKIQHVPYRGAPQGILAVMSGEVTMGFFNTPTVISQIKAGKLKALAVTSLSRSPLLPDVPTLDEQGVKGYEVNTWFGFVTRAGTPSEIISRLHGEIYRILADPELKKRLADQGFDIAPPTAPERFSQIIADDLQKWVPIVKASGAQVN